MNEQRAEEYRGWLAELNRLFPHAEAAIRDALNRYIDDWLVEHQGNERAAFCSSWIPGPNWNERAGGVYQPIFDTMKEMYGDEDVAFERAGWFFGLLLLDVIEAREATAARSGRSGTYRTTAAGVRSACSTARRGRRLREPNERHHAKPVAVGLQGCGCGQARADHHHAPGESSSLTGRIHFSQVPPTTKVPRAFPPLTSAAGQQGTRWGLYG